MAAGLGEFSGAKVIGDLVALLRDVHDSEQSPPAVTTSGRARKPPEALLDVLRRLHRGNGSRVDATAGETNASARYDRVREVFRRREQTLREESLIVDRILDRVRAGAAPGALPGEAVIQQTLRIACASGGRSGGRFLVVNETDAPARVTARFGRPSARSLAPIEGAALRLDPGALLVEAMGCAEAELSIDLHDCAAPVGERIDVAVELLDDARRLGRVWVEIVVEGPHR